VNHCNDLINVTISNFIHSPTPVSNLHLAERHTILAVLFYSELRFLVMTSNRFHKLLPALDQFASCLASHFLDEIDIAEDHLFAPMTFHQLVSDPN
jgi:hypothetical protein